MKNYLLWTGSILLWCSVMASQGMAQAPAFDRAIVCGSGDSPQTGWGPTQQAFDAQGNTYVTGYFNGTIRLGSTVLTATQTVPSGTWPVDIFIAKLDVAGRYVWAMQIGNDQIAAVKRLAVDSQGDVYVAGSFYGYSVTLGAGGPTLFNSSSSAEAFVGKLSGTTGQFLWARRAGGTGYDEMTNLTVSAAGDAYAVCSSDGNVLDFGPFTLTNATPYGNVYHGNFLVKLNAAGIWQWARPVGVGGIDVKGLVLDAQGDLYLSGTFEDSLTVGTTHLIAQHVTGTPLPRGHDIFVAKTTDAGVWRWAVQGDALTHQNLIMHCGELAADGNGHLYLTGGYTSTGARLGSFYLPNLGGPVPQGPIPSVPPITNDYYGNGFLAQLNASTGAWEQALRNGGTNGESVFHPMVSTQGQLYVTGVFTGVAQARLARPNWTGGTWTVAPLVSRLDIRQFDLDAQDRVNVLGNFDGSGPLTLGAFTLPPDGPQRVTGFLARLAVNPLATRAGSSPVAPKLVVWPNPAGRGAVWVQGPAPGQAVQVLDVLGRLVATGRMPTTGPLALPLALPVGLYLVRSAGQVRRLVVE